MSGTRQDGPPSAGAPTRTGQAFALRPATPADAGHFADIRVAAMRESLERIGRFDEARARARLLDAFDPALATAVEAGGTAIGFFVVRPADDGLLLDHLYLLPAWQGRGIGAAILAHVCAEADARGCALRVGALRGSASNRFYLRHGFSLVEEAEFDNYYCRAPRARPPARENSQ